MEHPTLLRTSLRRKTIWTLKLRDGNHHLDLGLTSIGTPQPHSNIPPRPPWGNSSSCQMFSPKIPPRGNQAVTMAREYSQKDQNWRPYASSAIDNPTCGAARRDPEKSAKHFPAPFDNQINILLPKLCCLQLFYFAPKNKHWYLPVFLLFGWVVKCKKCAKHFYLRHSRRYRDLQCFVKHVSKIYCK